MFIEKLISLTTSNFHYFVFIFKKIEKNIFLIEWNGKKIRENNNKDNFSKHRNDNIMKNKVK